MNRETALLQLLLTPGMGARSIGRLLLRLKADRWSVVDLPAASTADLTLQFGLPPLTAEAFGEVRDEAIALAESLAAHGISIVALTDDRYPSILTDRMGRLAPPVLFLRGESEALVRPMVGFAGARDCSEEGLNLARGIAAELAHEGVNIVSGYAPGIDTAAHFGAVSVGGTTTAVLASGILHFTPRTDLAPFCDERNTLIMSEFFPTMPWRSHSAMQRNRTICGLVLGMVIVESGSSGGTFAAGLAALEIGCPLYVVDWPDPPPNAAGNRELIRRGATPLGHEGGYAERLRPLLTAPPIAAAQPGLFE